MKKLLLLLVLAAPCALFGQVAFDANMLAFTPFKDDVELGFITPSFWVFYGIFPNGTIDAVEGTQVTGNETAPPPAGFGVSVAPGGGLSISGGIGIGYTITAITDASGNIYLILNVAATDTPFGFQHSMNLGFDTIGINLTPAQALDLLKSGSISQALFNALLRGSSADFQAQVATLQDPGSSEGSAGSNASDSWNVFSNSTDELGGYFDSPPEPDTSVTWPDAADQFQGYESSDCG